jgi:hypothetical protein
MVPIAASVFVWIRGIWGLRVAMLAIVERNSLLMRRRCERNVVHVAVLLEAVP